MQATTEHLFELFMPLLHALHEKKVLDIAEVPHFYEDALERRKANLGATEEDVAFLRQVILGLNRLAHQVKTADQTRPHGSTGR